MASIFNLSIPQLKQWSRRQLPDHRQLNEPVEAINRMTTGIAPPRMKAGQAIGIAAGVTVAAFRLRSVAGDYLICRPWGDPAGEAIQIAKPSLLRRTPFHNQTYNYVSYVYTSSVSRTATINGDVEEQIVIPPYVWDDRIVATSPILGGTDVIAHEGTEDEMVVIWEDDNRDARAWAAEYKG